MARLARVVLPGVAHHVTQRGNRRLPVFFGDDDRRLYLERLRTGRLLGAEEWIARQEEILLKLSSAMRNFHIFLLLFVASCSSEQGSGVCSYINAFGDSVNHSYFTLRNGQDDASKFAQNDRVGFIGGYLVTGPFTPVISGENSGIPLEFNRVFDKFGWNIEKLYLTDSLRNMKKGNFRSFDYGIRDGVQVDRDCYDKQLRDYAAAFNKAMLGRVL